MMVEGDMFKCRSAIQHLEHSLEHHKHTVAPMNADQQQQVEQWQVLDDIIRTAEVCAHTAEVRVRECMQTIKKAERGQQEAFNQYHSLRSKVDLLQSKVVHLYTSDPDASRGVCAYPFLSLILTTPTL